MQFIPSSEPAFELLQQRLNQWKRTSPIVVSLILQALRETTFYYSFRRLPPQAERVYVPPGFSLKLRPVVEYANHPATWSTAHIDAKLYLQLGDSSKAGLWIHEALRQVQLGYGDAMSDQALQETVAKIMLRDPQGDESLDVEDLFGTHVDRALRGNTEFRSEMTGVCSVLEGLAATRDDARVICRNPEWRIDLTRDQTCWNYAVSKFMMSRRAAMLDEARDRETASKVLALSRSYPFALADPQCANYRGMSFPD